MKKRCAAIVLLLMFCLPVASFAAVENITLMQQLWCEEFDNYSGTIPGYVELVEKGGSVMVCHGATDNPGDNSYTSFSVSELPSSDVFELAFDMCAEGHPSSGTSYFYVQMQLTSSDWMQMILHATTGNALRFDLGSTTTTWGNDSTDNFYTDTPVSVRIRFDRANETITGYINGDERASYTFSQVGYSAMQNNAVSNLRIYRYRGHFDTKFYMDNLAVSNSVKISYDPDTMDMNFSAAIDYSETNPKLVISNGTDSKYLAQDIKVSLISEADTTNVTNLGSVSLEKETDGTASFSLSESLPALSSGYYFVKLERYVGSVLKGALKQQKIYIATQQQLTQLPIDFSALPTDLSAATAKVEGYLPCFLTEEELTALLPKDTVSGAYTDVATNNLEFITKYFQNTPKTYADVTAVQTEFSKAKGYLELKNAADATQVRSVLVNGNYLTSYLTDEVFLENEAEFFKQFDTKRNDTANLLISDAQIADALRYAYAMTALNVADRSGIFEVINTYNDVFGVNLTATGVETVSADDLYAVFYHKDYMDISRIQTDWNQKLQELLNQADQKDSVTAERPFPPAAGGGGGGGGFGAATPTVLTPTEPPKPQVKPDELAPVSLVDMTNHWAKDYVGILSQKGIVNGFSDGTFRPDATLSRAELAVMLSRIISDYDEESVVNFADVRNGDWFYEAVLKMSALGIVQGVDGNFMPYESVTREQLAVMIYRALAPSGYSGNSVEFADSEQISAYAKEAISYLGGEGILSGFEDNTIRPKAETTRAQAAKLLSELLEQLSR